MPQSDFNLSRRQALTALGGAALYTWLRPITAAAQPAGAGFASPPEGTLIPAGQPMSDAYLKLLRKYPDFANAPAPDRLYALNCATRQGADLYGVSLTAPGYLDPASTSNTQPPVVGPTLEFVRGQTNGVFLTNDMTVCGDDRDLNMNDPKSGWTPHGFTTTNLHTHGLHVTPQAPSDDVLTMVRSTTDTSPMMQVLPTEYPYHYVMPDDHPVGTFWYHPHKHGSVASQVGPGMSGALIVRAAPGQTDFDELIAAAPYNITRDDEEVLVLQTVPFYFTNATQTEAVFYPVGYYDGTNKVAAADCYGYTLTTSPSPTPTTVNGQLHPTIRMDKGQIKRLRMVNATNGQTYVPKLRVKAGSTGKVPPVYAIAVDGITLETYGKANPGEPFFRVPYALQEAQDRELYWTTGEIITLAPGQRLDVLIKTDTPGTYELYGAALGECPMVVEDAKDLNTSLMATIEVSSTPVAKAQALPTANFFNDTRIKRPERPEVNVANLPQATQTLEFKTIGSNFTSSGIKAPPFVINGRHFDADFDDPAQVQLYKGHSDVWNLYSTNDAHIFHIHINSFQALGRAEYDRTRKVYRDPIPYLMPIWRDTIYFDGGPRDTSNSGEFIPGRMVVMASKQVDFTGEFVLHCHNLFHEDNGMMVTVAILDPKTGEYDPT